MSKGLMRRLESAEERLAGAGRVHVVVAAECAAPAATEVLRARGVKVRPQDTVLVIDTGIRRDGR